MKNNAYQESINSVPKVSGEIRLSEPHQANEKETAFLEEIENKEIGPDELTNEICEFLESEGKSGSAEYVKLFSKSTSLDKEVKNVENGANESKIIDTEKTSVEMAKSDKAYLKEDAKAEIMANSNNLKYKLNTHIKASAQKASEYYAKELTRKKSLKEFALGEEFREGDIPYLPDEAEKNSIQELANRKYFTREEMEETFQNELNFMMKKRPGMIGLRDSERISNLLEEVNDNLGGGGAEPKEVNNIRHLHEHMKGLCPKELGINPDFLEAVEKAYEK